MFSEYAELKFQIIVHPLFDLITLKLLSDEGLITKGNYIKWFCYQIVALPDVSCHRTVLLSIRQYYLTGGVDVMQWKRVEDLRIDNDLTQQAVANILCCQREVYRRYEKGIRELPLSYAIILSKYYDVSIDYMVGLTNNPKRNE